MKQVDKYFNGGFLMPKRQGGLIAFSKNNQSGFVAPRMKAGGFATTKTTTKKPKPKVELNLPKYEQRPGFFTGYGFSQNIAPSVNMHGVGAHAERKFSDRLKFTGDVSSPSIFFPGGNQLFINPNVNLGVKYRFGNGGDISIPNVYPNQMVNRFAEGGQHDCPEGFSWNEQRQACTLPDGRTFEELKASNDASFSDILKSGLLTGAGMAGAAYGIPRVINHPLVSTIPSVIRTKSFVPYGTAVAISAINRLGRPFAKLPITKNIYKKGALKVGSSSSGGARDIDQIISALRNSTLGNYTGHNMDATGYHPAEEAFPELKGQNLLKNYIYGDATGFTPSDLEYRNLQEYENLYKGPFKKYKLFNVQHGKPMLDSDAISMSNLISASRDMYNMQADKSKVAKDNFFIKYPQFLAAKDILRSPEDMAKFEKELREFIKQNKGISFSLNDPVRAVQDIAGHQNYLDYDPVTDQVNVTTQDIWKFTPKDYNAKWLKPQKIAPFKLDLPKDQKIIGGLRNRRTRDYTAEELLALEKSQLHDYLSNYAKYKQASLMEASGRPFVLLDRRPVSFDYISSSGSGDQGQTTVSAEPSTEYLSLDLSEDQIDQINKEMDEANKELENKTTEKKSAADNAIQAAKDLKISTKTNTGQSKKANVERTTVSKKPLVERGQLPRMDFKKIDIKTQKPLFKDRGKVKGRRFKFEQGGVALNQYYPGGVTSGFGVTDQTTIPAFLKNLNLPVYKINPWANVTAQESLLPNFLRFKKFESPASSFRIGNQASYQDFLNQGVVRSAPEGAPIELGDLGKVFRFTGFPSFAQGTFAPSYFSADRAGDVIFKTDVPTFKRGQQNPVTGNTIRGSHWAARPIDMTTGKVITELPGSQVEVFGGKPHWLHGYQKVFNPYDPIHTEIAGLKGLGLVKNQYKPQGLLEKFMFDYYDNNINKLENEIKKIEKTEGVLSGKPVSNETNKKILELSQLKRKYTDQKEQYRDKRTTRYADKLAASVPGGGFGESIGVGGFARGVFPFKDNPDFLMKVGEYPDYENVSELLEKSRPFRGRENISVPLQITPYPQRPDLYSTVLKRQPGKSLMRFENIPRQSVLDAIRKMRELERAGLKMDFAGDNLLLDPVTEKISLIDLGSDYSKFADENVLANILNQKYDKNLLNVLRQRYSIAPSVSDLRRDAAISANPVTKPDDVSAVTKPETPVNTAAADAISAANKLRQIGRTTATQPSKNINKKQKVVTKPITGKKVSVQGKKLELDATKFKFKEKSKIPVKKGKTSGRRGFTLKYGGTNSYDVNSVLDVNEQELPKMIEELRKQGYEFKITY